MKGWECPKCGACYGPHVDECKRDHGRQAADADLRKLLEDIAKPEREPPPLVPFVPWAPPVYPPTRWDLLPPCPWEGKPWWGIYPPPCECPRCAGRGSVNTTGTGGNDATISIPSMWTDGPHEEGTLTFTEGTFDAPPLTITAEPFSAYRPNDPPPEDDAFAPFVRQGLGTASQDGPANPSAEAGMSAAIRFIESQIPRLHLLGCTCTRCVPDEAMRARVVSTTGIDAPIPYTLTPEGEAYPGEPA